MQLKIRDWADLFFSYNFSPFFSFFFDRFFIECGVLLRGLRPQYKLFTLLTKDDEFTKAVHYLSEYI